MSLTELSIKNYLTTMIFYVLLVFGGYSAYVNMEKAEDPGFTIKTATITTYWPGATAEQMDRLIGDKISEVLESMEEIDYIESKNRDGISTVYFNASAKYWGDQLQPIWTKLRKKVYIEAMPNLPKGVVGPFVNDEFGDIYGTVISVTGDGFDNSALYEEANKLREKMLREVDQVGKVKVYGVQNERIYVEYDNTKLAELNISIKDIADALTSRNIIISGGYSLDGPNRMSVFPTGNFKSVEEIGDTVLNIPGKDDLIYLKDVASVTKGYIDPATYKTQYMGKPAISLSISLKKGEDNIVLGNNLKKLLDDARKEAPLGIDYNILVFQPEIVEQKVVSFVSNLTQAIITVLLVMFIFLGVRTGFIVASLVPTAIAITLIVLSKMGYGLNQMTLAGLIIALGMLVDNAIVISESIMVAMAAGKSKWDACVETVAALKTPLFISSLATMSAFSPVVLVEETMGEYVGPLSITVMIALFASWAVAMTLVPMLCYRYLQVEPKPENFDTPFYMGYRKFLLTSLRYRKLALIVIAAVFASGILMFAMTKKKFLPDSDRPLMYTTLRLPIGTSLERTEEVVEDLNRFVEKNLAVPDKPLPTTIMDLILTGGTVKKYPKPGIISWGGFIGGGAPRFTLSYSPESPASEYAYMVSNLTDYKLGPEIGAKIDKYLRDRYPDLEVFSRLLPLGNSATKNIEYRIHNVDLQLAKKHANEIIAKLETLDGLYNISHDWNQEVRKVIVDIDQERVRKAGLTSEEVALSLQSIMTGIQVTSYRNPTAAPLNSLVPVILRTTSAFRDDLTQMETTQIYSARTGKTVPLKQIADIKLDWKPGFVHTWHRTPMVKVGADNGVTPEITSKSIDIIMVPWLNEKIKEWNDGTYWELGGENESSDDNSASLNSKLPFMGIAILLLLVAQFNSFKKPLAILLTIPLGIVGVTAGLLLTGQKFGFMPMVGLVALIGILINNGIVLIDNMDLQLENGLSPEGAVVEACQRRFLPIVMATITTLCGLLPLWLFGSTLFVPLAVALIFGLIIGTCLTLGVLPIWYSTVFNLDFTKYEYRPLAELDLGQGPKLAAETEVEAETKVEAAVTEEVKETKETK